MEIINFPLKLVKPSTPTPKILRNYNISFIDELAPTNNIFVILYYSTPPNSLQEIHSQHIYDHLESSLSITLCEFYPFAGRYTYKVVDCSDQGVPYVRAMTKIHLVDIISLGQTLKSVDFLNNFLPSDDGDDPMLSIKLTTFGCGGFAIGMHFSHQISDVNNICTFINNWASRSKGVYEAKKYSPIFNSTTFFPPKGLPRLDLGAPKSRIIAHRFHFNQDTIIAMGKQVGVKENQSSRPSKVQLVVALLWKAFVHMDQETNGESKASCIAQPVELRKLVPELPMNSFGNFWSLAISKLGPGKGENLGFNDFFYLTRSDVKKTIKDCSKILAPGEEGYRVLIDSYMECNRNVVDNDVNFYMFTSFCNFSFSNADFGWGKSVWASLANYAAQNLVIMMDDQQGDGVEAWVHLDEKNMKKFEQDSVIKEYQHKSFSNKKIRMRL